MPLVNPALIEMLDSSEWNSLRPSPECQCSTPKKLTMLPVCPEGAGGLPPPQVGGWVTDSENVHTDTHKIHPLMHTAKWLQPTLIYHISGTCLTEAAHIWWSTTAVYGLIYYTLCVIFLIRGSSQQEMFSWT